ncbi:hypothetical protein Saro_2717 [Novosphingobium aromaticivorans DSM 12444]|uniref:CRISPR-associated protein Cas2 n=1 Tax=Novosphingobium aromaticivorans (strain ATCC 700278 / DSM 12444 / CCUG 56034 / CIP 105152 / NBRC 16084 / F199) TaxID=279238 RepID=Q2G4S0_NOVAD|nr:hypothetical protein [Novosphingobium aromaticivorans]ABD27153.1 hypothetical protein Saro_2717 [Novosphingobium aromaticivorans DSM 12444]SCY89553.1 hypothetical protein SAMN05660666_03473 [Novosphingobium aromaticivorans]
MAILLLTYDLKAPGRNYEPVFDYIKANYTWCKGAESVWLLETTATTTKVRDDVKALVDDNDIVFVVQITRNWASLNYYCGDWLNKPERKW